MKESEISLIYAYIAHERISLEQDIRQRQANIRFRDIDTIDLLELILATQRLDTFKEVTNNILLLLKLKK